MKRTSVAKFEELQDRNPEYALVGEVDLVVVSDQYKHAKLRSDGRLADVAPTLLKLMGLDQPAAMTGQSLLE